MDASWENTLVYYLEVSATQKVCVEYYWCPFQSQRLFEFKSPV